ncbi:SUN domain-containing protein 1-like [Cylas formicarius]|uniref:SUN domain-containing protein 1-like n=1 Tax=Cylas formicarius TaxID=197179 RepID=UPI002958C98D|nr:SUN domain-containing protein 1-like [Cylas formicarius]
MSLHDGIDVAELLPAYYCNNFRSSQGVPWRGICTHFVAVACAVVMCLGGFYYYQNFYEPYDRHIRDEEMTTSRSTGFANLASFQSVKESNSLLLDNLKSDVNLLREQIDSIDMWRIKFEKLMDSKNTGEINVEAMIEHALTIFSSDEIGLPDHAAYYAGGSIAQISKNTHPYPTHKPLSLFNLVQLDVLSSPEEILRPCTLPGSCFAFRGSTGSIRVRLAAEIEVWGVTVGHASRILVGSDGMASAPKDFEVYGFRDDFDAHGTFMGSFTYDYTSKQHQTFPMVKNHTRDKLFGLVELRVMSNYGNEEFTCIYRFRVHGRRELGKTGSARKCCN